MKLTKDGINSVNWKHLCFSYKGRINRSTFWIYQGLLFVVSLFIGLLVAIFGNFEGFNVISPEALLVIIMLIMSYSNITVCVKRMHDRDKSGWVFLFWCILSGFLSNLLVIIGRLGELSRTGTIEPIDPVADPARTPMGAFLLGVMVYIVIACGCRRGTHGPNKYGESPIQANDEETSIAIQNDEIEMVSKSDESISDDPPQPRIWELVLKFWKHTGAMVVIGVYTLLTLSLKIESFQVVEILPVVLITRFFTIAVYYWLPICLVAGLFSFLKKDPKTRVIRFRRIVFWGLLIVLSGMAAIQIVLKFHKVKVENLEGEYGQTAIFMDSQGRFQVSAPSTWSEMPDLNEEADMVLGEEVWNFYFQVLVEPKSDFLGTQIESLNDYKDLILEMMITDDDMNIVPVTMNVELTNTIQAEITGKLYGIINIIYYLVFVEDKRNYYQLIGHMQDRRSNYDPERRDIKKKILQDIINSFQIID